MVLLIVALLATVLLVAVALVIDLGYIRGTRRVEQSVVDLAALAAGEGLGRNDPLAACEDAVNYVRANVPDLTSLDAAALCTQAGQSVASTVCSAGPLAEAMPTITKGRYKLSIHYPVPASEITDPVFGAGLDDGVPCGRMRVILTMTDTAFFGAIVSGTSGYTTSRSATVVAAVSGKVRTPALWLLDPTGCTALNVSGGSQVLVGASDSPGVIMVDSDGTQCGGNSYTVSASGTGSLVKALDGPGTGSIGLHAMPFAAIACVSPACSTSDVTAGRVTPQPTASGDRATRAPVDWRFDCKASYPTYPRLQSPTGVLTPSPCPYSGSRSPYVSNLLTSLSGSSAPSGWTTISGAACSPTGAVAYAGNTWIDCPSGLSIGNGVTLEFTGGNLVLTGEVKMTGGALSINTANPSSSLPAGCAPPQVTSPCLASSSSGAAFVVFKAGGFNLTGGALTINHAAVLMTAASGAVKVTGGSPPSWTAPTQGPFTGLALWAEGKDSGSQPFQINGGANVVLSGAFFTPEAVMSLSGGGDWQIPQNAQFIAYRLTVTGGGVLRMSPDPATAVSAPPKTGMLIR